MKALILTALLAITAQASQFRTWTQAATGKSIVAKMTDKARDHSKAQVVTKRGKVYWLKSSTLAQKDQEYILRWGPPIDHLSCRVVKSGRGMKTIRVTVTTQQSPMRLRIGPLRNGYYKSVDIPKDSRWTQDVECDSKYHARLTSNGAIVDQESWNKKTGL